uniref:Ankyrin repeat domain-containing protein n=2 Tax=Paracidobacterium acidisoli TaxID=2303751 RepID=A0A372IQJ5_9BACT
MVEELSDPELAFLEMACVPRHGWHGSGTVEDAEAIRTRYPAVTTANIFAAAVLADEGSVRDFLQRDSGLAIAKGGPHGWDALTHLCFSRYLRLDKTRSEAFVRTARMLLDAGASSKTGWVEWIDHPNPRQTFESVLYGVAGIAQHVELTRLLIERGADPNDEETPYHVAETYDNRIAEILVESGRLNETSLTTLLLRKADWHDYDGMKYLLEHGANPNGLFAGRFTTLHQSLRRDNGIAMVDLLLDHGADPSIPNRGDGRSGVSIAIRCGRRDVLRSLERRGLLPALQGVERLIAACAKGDDEEVRRIAASEPEALRTLLTEGATLPGEFAGNGNIDGVRALLGLGVPVTALYPGDPYFEIPKDSTPLHVAAWRLQHAMVAFLLERGAPVNVSDGNGRTPLQLAIRGSVASHWKERRSPELVRLLLEAGASTQGIEIPCGYDDADVMLKEYGAKADV